MTGCSFAIGERVTWRYCPPGGYGYIFPIPAVVVSFGRGRVRIKVLKNDGSEALRYVKEESLTARNTMERIDR